MTRPLVPAHVDLTDFAFMPFEFDRLFQSETWVLSSDAEKVAALTLWGKSWHEVPAGSLPNNEKMLANLSGAPTRWKRVREMALRGWVDGGDGRLYHPVVCEKALEAWLEKLAAKLKGARGNATRWETEFDPAPFIEEITAIRALLKDLNPESRALRKKLPQRSHSDPPAILQGSQGTGQGPDRDKKASPDTYERLEVSEGSSEKLARALQEAGFPECASTYPGLFEAEREGVTPGELAALARKHAGKPLAYVIETARGRRRDAAERAGRPGAAAAVTPPPDPAMLAEAQARHELDAAILEARNDLRLDVIDEAKCEQRIADAWAKFRDRSQPPAAAVAGQEARA